MNEEFPDLEAPNLDFPNDNLAVAYEFFLNYYLHPYDIAVELFDFPDVIKNPFDNEEISKAAKKNLVTKKNVENFVLLKILDRKYREFAETRSIEVTEPNPHCQNSCHPHLNNQNGGKGDNHGTIQCRAQTSNIKQTAIA